jgi:peptidoglycan-associated lipoprotein
MALRIATIAAPVVAIGLLSACSAYPPLHWHDAAREQRLPSVIYFEFDGYKLTPEHRELLKRYAKQLKADPMLRLRVQAHADPTGPQDYNDALAEKRADTVVRNLIAQGVPARQLEPVAFGAKRPVNGGASDSLAKSRRVELVYR